ncbi:MAG: carbohydrate-binding domain-containing protein, partial [Lachnospiraceae bacterium]|nr:carbohydrate-binding domain-containing protein [Lachnospiraceae bacterium]
MLKTGKVTVSNRIGTGFMLLLLGALFCIAFPMQARAAITENGDEIEISGEVNGSDLAQYAGSDVYVRLTGDTVLNLDNENEIVFDAVSGPTYSLEIKGAGKLNLLHAAGELIKKLKISGGIISVNGNPAINAEEVVITGNADVNVTGGMYGLYVEKKLVISGGSLKASGQTAIGSEGTIEITGGTVTATSDPKSPIVAIQADGDITISGGRVTASTTAADHCAIETEGVLTVDETQAIVSATAKDKNGERKYPTSEDRKTIEISGAVKASDLAQVAGPNVIVRLTGDTVLNLDNENEIVFDYIYGGSYSLEIKGNGKLNMTGKSNAGPAIKKIKISGGTIYAIGEPVFLSEEVIITDKADVTLACGMVGIYVKKKLVISGGSFTVSANMPIVSEGTVEITGGKVTVISTSEYGSPGIDSVGDITISGGTVTASTVTADLYGIETKGTLTVDETKAVVSATTKDKNGAKTYKPHQIQPAPKKDIKDAVVQLSAESFTFNEQDQRPSILSFKAGDVTLTEGKDFTAVFPEQSKDAGVYTITLSGKGDYIGSKNVTYEIKKAGNPLSVKCKKQVTASASTLKKKNKTIKRAKYLTVSKKQGTVTYKKTKGNKKIVIDPKTGNIKLKKGLKKKTYKVTVKVTDAGNSNYDSAI